MVIAKIGIVIAGIGIVITRIGIVIAGIGIVIATRPRSPRDKAKVEVGVQAAQRWILARIRNQVFHSLAELNGRIRELLVDLNNRTMRRYGKSRSEMFECPGAPLSPRCGGAAVLSTRGGRAAWIGPQTLGKPPLRGAQNSVVHASHDF